MLPPRRRRVRNTLSGAPAAAPFLRAIWRLVADRPERATSHEVVDGLRRTRELLERTSPEERERIILTWLGELEMQHPREQRAVTEDRSSNAEESASGDLEWWHLR